MSQPKINTIGTFLVLLAVGAILPCHTDASDRAVIEVLGESEAEVMWFRPDAVLFTDRSYRLSRFPEAMAGEKFLRSSIDSTEFDVVQGGRLIVATPHRIDGTTSQANGTSSKGEAAATRGIWSVTTRGPEASCSTHCGMVSVGMREFC